MYIHGDRHATLTLLCVSEGQKRLAKYPLCHCSYTRKCVHTRIENDNESPECAIDNYSPNWSVTCCRSFYRELRDAQMYVCVSTSSTKSGIRGLTARCSAQKATSFRCASRARRYSYIGVRNAEKYMRRAKTMSNRNLHCFPVL